MDTIFIISVCHDDGSVISFLLPFDKLSECLSIWCDLRSLPCIVYSYELGSMTREEFMAWDAHMLNDGDIYQFEFEYDVSLFN